jgi:hypothetical protein
VLNVGLVLQQDFNDARLAVSTGFHEGRVLILLIALNAGGTKT